ncbi:MAG: tRNA (adenosine(37)-N6)-threonylcarbamoyltransferase complex ATPase subunit type 1 TsaE, partial [Candidatus Moraniibacteriota bacterium]
MRQHLIITAIGIMVVATIAVNPQLYPRVELPRSRSVRLPPTFFFAKNDIYATIELMKESFITANSKQTQKLGEILAKELKGGEIICLSGELGSGKTTFAQGVLHGLGAKKPHTSPTFVVMKEYKAKFSIFNFQFSNNSQISKFKKQKKYKIPDTKYKIQNIYHIDA